jgi:UDPglucose--hexose-1-phosphate uridylyltransferase
MPIRFERREKITRYLDPRQDYAENQIRSEIRWDPLTGRTARVAHFVGFQLAPVDYSAMIAATRDVCPFCPERVMDVTPKFPPDIVPTGRVQKGAAIVFPNLSPYDEHSAVAVMGPDHYVPLDGFTPDMLTTAFLACSEYFGYARQHPGTRFALVNWNYMPAAGGTQIHPHLQVFATDTAGNTHREELEASGRYYAETGRSYWADLLETEERLGERFVARGQHTVWCTSFVSQSPLTDVLVVFPERRTLLELSENAVAELAQGLVQTFRYLAARGVYSFNLAWFPGTEDRPDYWMHLRLSPRLYLSPRVWAADTSTLQHLYRESYMIWTPEEEASGLRKMVRL